VDLMLMFARLQASLGERARATALAEQADNLARATLDPMQPKAIDAIALRGERYVRDGAHARGEPLLLEARRRLDATGSHGVTLLHVLDNLAVVEMDRDRAGVALALSRQALQERRRAYGDEGKETASGYNNLGYGLVGVGRFDEAASAYRRAYEIDLRYRQPDSYGVLAGLSNWGWAMALGGHARDARARLAEVDDGLRKLGGKPRGFHILNSEKLCIVDVQVGAAAFAERDCRRMLELTVAVTGLDSTDHAAALTVDAARLLASGDMRGAKAVLDRAGAAFPDTAQYARENGSVLAYRAEIAWLDGDAAGARRDALAARPLMALQKDKRVVSLGLDGLLVLACSRAPAAQCPADLERTFLDDLDHHAASSDVRLVLPRLVAARRLLDRGDAQAAARSIGQTLGKARVELDEGNALVATARVWHALALDLGGDCSQAAHEREAAETISGYGSYPWLAEARTALSARARCPKLH
jgi:hypothetical protein